jgi:hypothetical protein
MPVESALEAPMSDSLSYTVNQIEKIGLICQKCNTEVVLSLQDKDATAAPQACPVCAVTISGTRNDPQKPFTSPWLKQMLLLKYAEDSGSVRFYFKEK